MQRLADLGHEKEKLVDERISCFKYVLLFFGTDQLSFYKAKIGRSWSWRIKVGRWSWWYFKYVLLFLGTHQLSFRQRLADLSHEKEKLVDGSWSCSTIFCSTLFRNWSTYLRQRLADLGHEIEKLVYGSWLCFNHVLLFLGTD